MRIVCALHPRRGFPGIISRYKKLVRIFCLVKKNPTNTQIARLALTDDLMVAHGAVRVDAAGRAVAEQRGLALKFILLKNDGTFKKKKKIMPDFQRSCRDKDS